MGHVGSNLLGRPLLLVVIACSAVVLALNVWLATSGLVSIRGVDLNVVFTIQKVLLGSPLYTDPAAPPFDIAQYGPLFYLLAATLAKLGGVGGDEPETIIAIARGTSMAAAFSIAAVMYVFLRRHAHASVGLAVAASGFGFVATSPWYSLARPDALMALCLLAVLFCTVAAVSALRPTPWLLAAGALAFAAAFTKQNGLIALAIVLTWAVFRRDARAAAMLLVGFAAPTLLLLVTTSAGMLGDFVSENLIDGLDNGISLSNALARTYLPFLKSYAGLVLAALFVAVRWPRLGESHVRLPLLLALGWTFAAAVLTGIKLGSAENYFNEFILVAALACSAFAADARVSYAPVGRAFSTLVALYLLILLPVWTALQVRDYWLGLRGSARIAWFDESIAHLRALDIEQSGLLVLGPRGFANALPGHGIMPQPELVGLAYRRRTVDYTAFRNLVAGGQIAYVVHGPDRPLRTYLGADFSDFVVIRAAGEYVVSAHPDLVARRPGQVDPVHELGRR